MAAIDTQLLAGVLTNRAWVLEVQFFGADTDSPNADIGDAAELWLSPAGVRAPTEGQRILLTSADGQLVKPENHIWQVQVADTLAADWAPGTYDLELSRLDADLGASALYVGRVAIGRSLSQIVESADGSPIGLAASLGGGGGVRQVFAGAVRVVDGATGPVGRLTWLPTSGAYLARPGDRLLLDSAGGAFIVTLPADPAEGAEIEALDGAGACEGDPVTFARNGQTLAGAAEDFTFDVAWGRVVFTFSGGTWLYRR